MRRSKKTAPRHFLFRPCLANLKPLFPLLLLLPLLPLLLLLSLPLLQVPLLVLLLLLLLQSVSLHLSFYFNEGPSSSRGL